VLIEEVLKRTFTIVAIGSGEHFRMIIIVLDFQIFPSMEAVIGRDIGTVYSVISSFPEG
jgi:hypothetical protein